MEKKWVITWQTFDPHQTGELADHWEFCEDKTQLAEYYQIALEQTPTDRIWVFEAQDALTMDETNILLGMPELAEEEQLEMDLGEEIVSNV